MSVLYVVRHAQASFGSRNYDKLSALGKSQAIALGDYFGRTQREFHAVYSGSMQRHLDTARLVLERMQDPSLYERTTILEEFDEYDSAAVIKSQVPGMIQTDPSISHALAKLFVDEESFRLVFDSALKRWISGRHDVPGVETWKSFSERIQTGVRTIMEENRGGTNVALFTSGGPLSVISKTALELTDSAALKMAWQILNSSVSVFRFKGDRLGMSSFNSTAHLELMNDPDLITYR